MSLEWVYNICNKVDQRIRRKLNPYAQDVLSEAVGSVAGLAIPLTATPQENRRLVEIMNGGKLLPGSFAACMICYLSTNAGYINQQILAYHEPIRRFFGLG